MSILLRFIFFSNSLYYNIKKFLGQKMNINEKIQKLCYQRGWSMYELAQEAGITQSTLTSMMKRGNPPKIENLQFICDAFGISLSQFFMEDEKLEIVSEEEKELLTLFRKMSESKKTALIDLLKN